MGIIEDYRFAIQSAGWIGFLDSLGHDLHLPRRIQNHLCDRYDAKCLGVSLDEIREMDAEIREMDAAWRD